MEMDAALRTKGYANVTLANRGKALRQILRWLWEHHGAPKLDQLIRKYPAPRPRNICITPDEHTRLLIAMPPHIKLWALLCSDLAIRSGTARNLNPADYEATTHRLTFTTKCDEHLTLSVTEDIAALLDECDHTVRLPYVSQLWKKYNRDTNQRRQPRAFSRNALNRAFRRALVAAGITRQLTPHDLRRTTAVAMYKLTGDLRDAQAILGHKNLTSTFWYLDHDVRPIKRSTLELIKTPAWRKENIA